MFQAFQFRWLAVLGASLLAGFGWLQYRLVVLQIVRHKELSAKAEHYTRMIYFTEPWRGEIRDRAGNVLALSVPVKTIYADLAVCANRPTPVARVLASQLRTNEAHVANRLRTSRVRYSPNGESVDKKSAILKRHVMPWEWERIKMALNQETYGIDPHSPKRADKSLLAKLRQRAVFAGNDQARVYPYAASFAHLLGYIGSKMGTPSLEGKAGIERALEKQLAGARGFCVSEKDAGGHELVFRRTHWVAPVNGNHVVLTIDLRLQQIVEQALAEAMVRHNPRNASALIVRPQTGEILALASLPAFLPQNPGASSPITWRNPVISDMIEPGSTFKIVTLAAALNEAVVTLDRLIFCENGRFRHKGLFLHDHAPHGWLTAKQAFAKSSNIGLAKTALLLGQERLYSYITNFGFGEITGIPLPSEMPGWVPHPTNWSGISITRIPIGHEVAVTQLQMTMAFCAIANDGRLMRPMLIDRLETPQGELLAQYHPQFVRSVVSFQAARQTKAALKAVISREGTGKLADLDAYSAAGKTGTALQSNKHGYIKGKYSSSFIGFFPADEPELCISVVLNEPHNGYLGGSVAAPVFKAIAQRAGPALGIPPDKGALPSSQRLIQEAATKTPPVQSVRKALASGATGDQPYARVAQR